MFVINFFLSQPNLLDTQGSPYSF